MNEGNPMKRKKIWLLNLILVLLICVLLACSHILKSREPEINTDILTPEIEIPAGGERIDEQADQATTEEGNTEADDNGTGSQPEDTQGEDSQDNTGNNSGGDIVTPEF